MAKVKSITDYEVDLLSIYNIPYKIISIQNPDRPRASKVNIRCPIHLTIRNVRLSNVLEWAYGPRYQGRVTGTHCCKPCLKEKRALR